MKLIKINTDRYVIVDDSKPEIGDWVYSTDGIHQWFGRVLELSPKKITHSTPNVGGLSALLIAGIKELPLSEVKELIGEVDVEKKAEEYKDRKGSIPTTKLEDEIFKLGFKDGYNQALEDNKEKKYTKEDLRKALSQAFMASQEGYQITSDEIVQSLQPKTEWEVEFDENGKLRLV